MERQISQKEKDVIQKAEEKEERRKSARKIVNTIWNKGGDEVLEVDEGARKSNKDMELTQTAETFELKRKVSGEWLARCN